MRIRHARLLEHPEKRVLDLHHDALFVAVAGPTPRSLMIDDSMHV